MPLGPFFGSTFERNSTSIFSFELRNWIKKGPDTDGHTDTHGLVADTVTQKTTIEHSNPHDPRE